ncbi:MAG: hypothetical protein FWD31_01330 [Planctomycetaceae bacterium]|nr:hypothetical protein [Planctomycetaceae bacterium]
MAYTCPYCFTPVDHSDVWFQCSVAACAEPNERRSRFEAGLEENQPTPQGFPIKPSATVFQGSPSQSEGVCPQPQCHRKTSIRVCPICHSPFPPGIEGLSNTVIAIVGARETGKSHYIAVLIQLIRQLYRKFGWTLSALDDDTMDYYRRVFYEPLYLRNESLTQTSTATGNEDVKKPLLYSLNFFGKNQTVILAFFDSAGEDLTSLSKMRRLYRYINNADGIILLLDPLLVPSVRDRVQTVKLPSPGIISYHNDIVNLISNLIIEGRKLTRDQQIKTPLAVAFSKIDVLEGIFGDDYARFKVPSPHHKGIFGIDDFQSNSEFIENWIDELAPGLIQGCGTFQDVGYFGVSALGKDPVESHKQWKVPGGPIPMHVEDPFLWLLYMNGMIPGK